MIIKWGDSASLWEHASLIHGDKFYPSVHPGVWDRLGSYYGLASPLQCDHGQTAYLSETVVFSVRSGHNTYLIGLPWETIAIMYVMHSALQICPINSRP